MSLQEQIKAHLEADGVEYSKLIVTKGVNYKGRKGVKVSFFIEDKIFFTTITDDLNLSNEDKADLVRDNVGKALSKYKRGEL